MYTKSSYKRYKTRRAQRGAILVEAIIVIIFFIIVLTGSIFFRMMYQTKVRTMRLSRAAAVRYAMLGCQGDMDIPDETSDHGWHLSGSMSIGPQEVASKSADIPMGTDPNADFTPEAQASVGDNSGVSSAIGLQITTMSYAGDVSFTPNGNDYEASAGSTSYVACADPFSTDDEYLSIIPRVKNAFPF